MKIKLQLAALEPLVLQPLHGLSPEAWHAAPAAKWSVAQIVAHLARGVDLSSSAFRQREDRQGMERRATPAQALLRHVLLGIGRFTGGRQAPPEARPPERPEPELVMAQFRIGVERFVEV